MHSDPLQISLETLIGVSPMLGYALENRGEIRSRQDWELVQSLQADTSQPLRDASQCDLFCVAPFDVLVTESNGARRFHIIEMNGTGIGGLSNMTTSALEAVLRDCAEFAEQLAPANPLILVASSGKEDDEHPRLNRLLHEKILYVEALRRGFEQVGLSPRITTMTQLQRENRPLPTRQPVIVLGYMKEFLHHLTCDDQGRLWLHDRQVLAGINDRFCLNVMHHFDGHVDLEAFQGMNRCFVAGGDKGVFYQLVNDFLAGHPHARLDGPIHFERAADREHLIDIVDAWTRQGRKAVIKPQGTGRGHGIAFFLSPREDRSDIAARVDASIRETEHLYGLRGGAFPYTVCEFVDTLTIPNKDHRVYGHKYELRVPVYRDGMTLKAFPSIVKISSERYDVQSPSHLSLINNITASSYAKQRAGAEFMLPLANRSTWELIGLTGDDIRRLCATVTSLTRYVLDQTQDRPELFQLPAGPRQAETRATRRPTWSSRGSFSGSRA